MDQRGSSIVAARLALCPLDLLPSQTHRSLSPANRSKMTGPFPEELGTFQEESPTRKRRGSLLHSEVLLLPSEDDVSESIVWESNSETRNRARSALRCEAGYRVPLWPAPSLRSLLAIADDSSLPSSPSPMLRDPVPDANAPAAAASSGTFGDSRSSINAGGNGDDGASGGEQCTSLDVMREDLLGMLCRTPRRAPLPFPFLYRYTVPLSGQSDEEDCNYEGREGNEDNEEEEEGEQGLRRKSEDTRKDFVSEAAALVMMRAQVLGTRCGTPVATRNGGSAPLRARTRFGSPAETPKSLSPASGTSGGLELNSDRLATTRFGSRQRNPWNALPLPHEPSLGVNFNVAETARCKREQDVSGHVQDNCGINFRGDCSEDDDAHAIFLQTKRTLVLGTRHGSPCCMSHQQQEQQQRLRAQQNQRQQQHGHASKRILKFFQHFGRQQTQSVDVRPTHSSRLFASSDRYSRSCSTSTLPFPF